MFGWLQRKRPAKLTCHWAGVYLYQGRLMVHAGGMTKEGLGIAAEPVFSCAVDDVAALGGHVRAALTHSRGDLDFPADKAYFLPILAQAGVKSWGSLEKEARHIIATEQGDTVKLIPHRTCGTRGKDKGFTPLPEREKQVDNSISEADLGQAVLAALEDCVAPDDQ